MLRSVQLTAIHHSQKETPAKTANHFPLPTPAEETAYITRLIREVTRIAGAKGRNPFDTDDIVQGVLERFLTDVPRFMRDYTPKRFAREATSQVAVTFDRKERVQRSEGVRLHHVDDGSPEGYYTKARSYASGSEPILDGDGELLDTAADCGEALDDAVVESAHTRAMLGACLQNLSPRQREFLMMVDGYGFTVVEVAELVALRRETVSRELSKARHLAQTAARQIAGSGNDKGVDAS